MPRMTEPRELFLHELEKVMFAEKTLAKLLATLQGEAADNELAEGFERHASETKGHIANLETVFDSIGETPGATRCPGIKGLRAEHDDFVAEEDPAPEILDLFLTGAAARAEHYELAAYTGLVEMAMALGETRAASLLDMNLMEERKMLLELEATARRLGRSTAVAAV